MIQKVVTKSLRCILVCNLKRLVAIYHLFHIENKLFWEMKLEGSAN